MLCFPTSLMYYVVLHHYLAKEEPRRQCTGRLQYFVCATQSNCCSALDSFFLNRAPKSSNLNALITRFRESYTIVSMSRESKTLKKSSSHWVNSGNALIQRVENAIFVFPFLPGSAEAQVI